jgi:SAM-dependent methyltransferase
MLEPVLEPARPSPPSASGANWPADEYHVTNEWGAFRIVRTQPFGYLRVDPSPSPEFLANFYATAYRNPTRVVHPEVYVALLRRSAPELFADPAARQLLEIGAGGGEVLRAFSAAGFRTFGFEPGQGDYDACRAAGLELHHGMYDESVARGRGAFDVCVLVNVLEHTPDPQGLLTSLRSLAGAGTRLLLVVPNDFNQLQRAFVEARKAPLWFLSPPDHLNYFQPHTLDALLAHCGWRPRVRTTRFPMELFLVSGRDYVQDPTLGRACHLERVEFERTLLAHGVDVLLDFYEGLASKGFGREIVIVADPAP